MSAPEPWLLVLLVATTLMVLGATSGLVNSRLAISEPLVCALAGVALGPHVLGFLRLDVLGDQTARDVFREAARVTLAIAVLGAAIRLPQGWIWRHWRGLMVALGPGLVLMWIAGSAIAAVTLGLPLSLALLVGAIMAPTDPVLSAPVVSGALARDAVPADLRHAIDAESAANDGLAQPLVLLPLAFVMTPHRGAAVEIADWIWTGLIVQTGGAVLFGAAAGWIARACQRWAAAHRDADHASLLTIALALALATLGGLQTIGGNGVLAAFVAGTVLNEAYNSEYVTHQEHFNEAISRFFDLPIMFLFGAALPWQHWVELGWPALAFACAILLLRRIPAWLLLGRLMPWTRARSSTLFAGWFGPIGAAALFYAAQVQDDTGLTIIWPVVSLAVAASVVAHGMTGTHFSHWLRRVQRGVPEHGADADAESDASTVS